MIFHKESRSRKGKHGTCIDDTSAIVPLFPLSLFQPAIHLMLPESVTLMLNDDVSMEFRLLPAGEFRMGSRGHSSYEEPIHRVVITRPFYMGILSGHPAFICRLDTSCGN